MIENFRKNCKEKLMQKSDYFIKAAENLYYGNNIYYDSVANCVFHNLVSKASFYEFIGNLIYKE